MRKILIICSVFALVAALTVPVAAVENKFGGYWRTRAYSKDAFTGDKSESLDLTQVDTRTRLYYTAQVNENLKFVNKFEMDAVWGKNPADTSYGDFGADAVAIEVKNSYADFNLGDFNFKVGTQFVKLARGFIVGNDVSGLVGTYKAGGFNLPFYWIKGYEGGVGNNTNDYDVDFYAIAPSFKAGSFKLQPYVAYYTSDDYSVFARNLAGCKDLDVYYLGADLDGKVGPASLWVTFIYESGNATDNATLTEYDLKGYLAAAGATMKFGSGDIHGQFFTATGDDNDADTKMEQYFVTSGAPGMESYTWAEIMGEGIIDTGVSANSPGRGVTNITAVNIGISFNPTKKLKVALDVWQASLAEKDANGEDELGIEVDLIFTYQLLKNLNLDLVGAMLMTGDATYKGTDQEDVTEIAAQLSFNF